MCNLFVMSTINVILGENWGNYWESICWNQALIDSLIEGLGQASVTSVIVKKFGINPYSRETWEFKDGQSTFHDDEA